jgi:hypothetical protein
MARSRNIGNLTPEELAANRHRAAQEREACRLVRVTRDQEEAACHQQLESQVVAPLRNEDEGSDIVMVDPPEPPAPPVAEDAAAAAAAQVEQECLQQIEQERQIQLEAQMQLARQAEENRLARIYCITPGQALTGTLNYRDNNEHRKLYQRAAKSLLPPEELFSVNPNDIADFLTLLKRRAAEFGWNTGILMIRQGQEPDAPCLNL